MECYGQKLNRCNGFVRVPALSEFLIGYSTQDQANFITGLYHQGIPTADVALIVDSFVRGGEGSSSMSCSARNSELHAAEIQGPHIERPPEYDFKAPD